MSKEYNKGGFVFKYRGQLPLVFLLCISPLCVYFYYPIFPINSVLFLLIPKLLIALGIILRIIVVGHKAPHTSGRNRHQHVAESLNTKGLYSITQHPLYQGSFCIWLGISLLSNNLLFLLMTLIFSLIFLSLIVAEEKVFLRQKFGDLYLEWSNKTPGIFINPFSFKPSHESFNTIRVLSTEYPTWVSVLAGCLFIELTAFVHLKSLNTELCVGYILFGLIIGFLGRWFKYVVVPKYFKHSI